MDMIKELWYGNIIPGENGIFNKPQFKELLGYTARHRAELEEILAGKSNERTTKQKERIIHPLLFVRKTLRFV